MDETAFPPADLKAFLTLCVGCWMSLRSRFDLSGSEEDDWHTSDRGEVTVTLSDQSVDSVLSVQSADGAASELRFASDGGLVVLAGGEERSGRWQLRADASLELELKDGVSAATVLERIWFIKPNLRLRSTTAIATDGTPLQARFCSEIRRVSSPQP
ncbi:phycobiliprotein lyase [Synechococcus sp. UW179A]|uniref:phycobiliprotein lyase n=1 Tax=Synechococcus sp. UW179A TaxID=2575510 RepID=UPI000E0F7D10|nr:phycobiliprotein lyase [Synechococcus sp. UW179A]